MASLEDEVALADTAQPITARWRMRLLVAGCVLAMLLLYWPTTLALSSLWLDTDKTTFTHGFIVLGISFWLMLRDDRLEQLHPTPSLFAMIAYLLGSIGWLIAYRASIETAHELAFPVIALLAVWSMFGIGAARLAAFPIGFLLFAIPVWDVLTPHLQTVSASMVGYMLHASGIEAYVDGNFVHIPAGIFEIAGGCSGLHFVMVGLALGTLYGELGRDSLKTRSLLVALAFFLAIAANWVRVYVIVVAGHLTNMQHYLVRVEHYRFGWVVFAVMMGLFFWIASRFPSSAVASFTKPETQQSVKPRRRPAYALALLVVPAWALLDPMHSAPVPTDAAMRPSLSGWVGPLRSENTRWNPVFAGADVEDLSTYEDSAGARVWRFVAAYRKQQQGKELVGYNNHLFSDSDTVVDSREIAPGIRELVLQDGPHRSVLRFSYHIGKLQTASGLRAQLSYGVQSLWSAPLSRIVAVRTDCVSDCEAARRRLDAFESALSGSPR
ncbi:MAG TPA: exosortase A [Steroidobacteraceae bacterium]|nr:exosortase A [Steroidobacteraceae bacterium]